MAMPSVQFGLSDSQSQATQFGSTSNTFSGGNVNTPNYVMWIVIGVIGLVAAVFLLKRGKKGRR